MPPLKHTQLDGPGSLVINGATVVNGTAKPVAEGEVDNDGRVTIHLNDNIGDLSHWVTCFQNAFSEPSAASYKNNKHTLRRGSRLIASPTNWNSTGATPRFNIAIHIVGSRGDVQPFIPIAQLLMKEPCNYRVRICTHPVFKDFVESQGIEFFSIGGDPGALMAYMVKNPGLLPGRTALKSGEIGKRRQEMWEIMKGAWRSCIESGNGMGARIKASGIQDPADLFIADAIIANPPSMAHIHCAEKLGIPLHMVFTMPWSPTKVFSHPLASMSYGNADRSIANYLSFIAMELLTWEGLGDLVNRLRTRILGLDPISPLWGFQLLPRLRVPYTYLWSKALIPKPQDWDNHISVDGFSYLPLAKSYTPSPDLMAFFKAGPTPIYIGFGSIVIHDPQSLYEIIFEAIKISDIRAIIARGWTGFGKDNAPDNVYFIDECPHDWLFQHVQIVIHHGGAGTTAAGIAAGRPTIIIPFFGDQPFWGQMIAQSGAGPIPIALKDLTPAKLAQSIKFCMQVSVQRAAQLMADVIAAENGAMNAVLSIQNRMELGKSRCDLCPERLAVWKHKTSGALLSGLAMQYLVNEGKIEPSSIRLHRQKRWYIDEGPENPILSVTAAFTGFFQAVGIAAADYSLRLQGRADDCMRPEEMPCPKTFATKTDEIPGTGDSMRWTIGRNGRNRDIENNEEGHNVKAVNKLGKTRNRINIVVTATGQLLEDITIAGIKTPIAVLYNAANGFHNYPSYSLGEIQVRRREEITGLRSGLKVARHEFVLGTWDAISGIGIIPFKSAQKQGPKGLVKGVWLASTGFICNISAAMTGLLGYPLKGFEKELSKGNITKIDTELISIRLMQSALDYQNSTAQERDAIVAKWCRIFKPPQS